jgi:hypothetical protein
MLGAGVPSAIKLPKSVAQTLRTIWTQIQEVRLAPTNWAGASFAVEFFSPTLRYPFDFFNSLVRSRRKKVGGLVSLELWIPLRGNSMVL